MIGVALGILVAAGAVWFSLSHKPRSAAPHLLQAADLDRAPTNRWVPIASTGVIGGFSSFDPIANYVWALRIAKTWSADAKLLSVNAEGAPASGVPLDVSSAHSRVEYVFSSPARAAAAKRMRQVSHHTPASTLAIAVEGGRAKARLYAGSRSAAGVPAPRLDCSLRRLMSAATGSGRLKPRTDYSALLMPVSGRWQWSVSGAGGGVVIDPASCAVRQ